MPTRAVQQYEAAVAAEREAFSRLQSHTAGTPEYAKQKDAWVDAIKRTEEARAAMLRAWDIHLDTRV